MDYFECLEKTVDALITAWERFTVALSEVVGGIAKGLGEEQGKVKLDSSPRNYGMSLIKKNEQLPRYFYRPVPRRNLPYQRRRF